jgi:hypothetical protein
LLALATALDAFLRAGMIEHARPLVAELLSMLRGSEAIGADIIPLPRR